MRERAMIRMPGQMPWSNATITLLVFIAACGQTSSENPTVTLAETRCVYQGPSELDSGPLTLDMVNETEDRFDLDVWLLSPGHDFAELEAHLSEEQRRLEAGEPSLGHPTFATLVNEGETNDTGELVAELSPGTYGMACIRFSSGVPVQIWAAGQFTVS